MILYCLCYTSNVTGARKVMLTINIRHLFNMVTSANYTDVEVSLIDEKNKGRLAVVETQGTCYVDRSLL